MEKTSGILYKIVYLIDALLIESDISQLNLKLSFKESKSSLLYS